MSGPEQILNINLTRLAQQFSQMTDAEFYEARQKCVLFAQQVYNGEMSAEVGTVTNLLLLLDKESQRRNGELVNTDLGEK